MPSPGRHGPILLVEDDTALRGLYQAALRLGGFDVVAVGDGLAALRWIELERPAAIVLDLGLPRLSGRDLQREPHAHAETHDIPIVVVTGQELGDLNESDVACVLRKPASPESVVTTVRRSLRYAS